MNTCTSPKKSSPAMVTLAETTLVAQKAAALAAHFLYELIPEFQDDQIVINMDSDFVVELQYAAEALRRVGCQVPSLESISASAFLTDEDRRRLAAGEAELTDDFGHYFAYAEYLRQARDCLGKHVCIDKAERERCRPFMDLIVITAALGMAGIVRQP